MGAGVPSLCWLANQTFSISFSFCSCEIRDCEFTVEILASPNWTVLKGTLKGWDYGDRKGVKLWAQFLQYSLLLLSFILQVMFALQHYKHSWLCLFSFPFNTPVLMTILLSLDIFMEIFLVFLVDNKVFKHRKPPQSMNGLWHLQTRQ